MQVKEWAKANNVNDPKSGTLSSYSLCLLVIFHFQVIILYNFFLEIAGWMLVRCSFFQTCSPAIFPPLKVIYGGNLLNDFNGMPNTINYFLS